MSSRARAKGQNLSPFVPEIRKQGAFYGLNGRKKRDLFPYFGIFFSEKAENDRIPEQIPSKKLFHAKKSPGRALFPMQPHRSKKVIYDGGYALRAT